MKLTEKEQQARKMVCLPLDNLEGSQVKERATELSPVIGLAKIGYGTFTKLGHAALNDVRAGGIEIFLDLKYNDIPNTVEDAAAGVVGINAITDGVRSGVRMFNLHATGGLPMMKAAVAGVDQAMEQAEKDGVEIYKRPKILGVTILTSLSAPEYLAIHRVLVPILSEEDLAPYRAMNAEAYKENQEKFAEMLIAKGYEHLTARDDKKKLYCNVVEQEVLNLALMSNEAGLDGIVCSPADLKAVKPHLPEGFMYVTPGVKGPKVPAGSDQARVFTPGNAVKAGSSILVIGRAITGGKTPAERLQRGKEVLEDMAQYL